MDKLEAMQIRISATLNELREMIDVEYQSKSALVKTALANVKIRFSRSTVLRDLATSVQRRLGPYKQPVTVEKFFTLIVEISNTVQIKIVGNKRRKILVATLGKEVPRYTEYSVQRIGDSLTVQYFDYGTLVLTHSCPDGHSHQYDIHWQLDPNAATQRLEDQFSFCEGHTYGGSLHPQQTWPMNRTQNLSPFITSDPNRSLQEGFGSIVEPYWLSSSGLAVYVDPSVPLFVGLLSENSQTVTLVSELKDPYHGDSTNVLCLKYSLFQCRDVKHAHGIISKLFFPKRTSIPNKELLINTIWEIRSSDFTKDITSGSMLQFVNDILKHGFLPGTLEIGDGWSASYGDMEFDQNRFPELKAVIQAIQNKGFRVLLWVHPFAGPKSKAFYSRDNLWIKSRGIDALTTWKHGLAKLFDVTNPAAQLWFQTNLSILQRKYNIDGFHFDFGETGYLQRNFHSRDVTHNPGILSTRYVKLAEKMCHGSNFGLCRTGYRAQDVPLVFELPEKDNNWGTDNGLAAVIPTVLATSLMGYGFVLPGSVGGGSSKKPPDRELYVRWLETVILMPVVKMTVPPWRYDEKTVRVVQRLFSLRKRLQDYLLAAAGESEESGVPVVRPVWWLAPYDTITFTLDSQYMVGDRLMVAPVLTQGASHRTIYLPRGRWRDGCREEALDGAHGRTGGGERVLQGPRWLYSYKARLGDLPHFMLLGE